MDTREAITQLVFVSDAPKHVDIIFVLGSAYVSSMVRAVQLYHQGFADKILISGKGPTRGSKAESEVFADYALNRGIPESVLMVHSGAQNTRDNFVYGSDFIANTIGWQNVSTIAIVTTPIHTRRALMTACQYFPSEVQLTVIPSTGDEVIQADTWWRTSVGRRLVLEELRKIGEYGSRGHLGAF